MASGAYAAGQGGNGSGDGCGPIQLAHEPPFRLGALEILPAVRQLRRDGRSETLEPRVMQVLVALGRAAGEVVSRDDLVDLCWEGRTVGDDAINRVIGRLRRLAESLGESSFRIETVTKVGYRLAVAGAGGIAGPPAVESLAEPAAAPSAAPGDDAGWPVSRRNMIRGAAAAGVAAATSALWTFVRDRDWWPSTGHVPAPAAKRFYEEGFKAQYFGSTETTDQAEAYFRQAAAADPQWADAWGSLAMSYRHMLDGETSSSQWRLVEQTRSAAGRALALDPDNAEAKVALALIRSPYRRWWEAEAAYSPLVERFPRAFVLRGHLGALLRDVGRFSDAVRHAEMTVEQQPFVAIPAVGLCLAYWGAGRLHEAEATIERAIARWPKMISVWFLRFEFLTYTGRTDAAIAFAGDVQGRPTELPEFLFERRIKTARAIATRKAEDLAAGIGEQEKFIQRSLSAPNGVVPARFSVPFFATIGDLDRAFQLLEGYYFDRGRDVPPQPRPLGELTRRETFFLFMPATAALRSDRRFAPLLEELKLTEYWRRTQSLPDYRRRAG